jgi:hypothetical protein
LARAMRAADAVPTCRTHTRQSSCDVAAPRTPPRQTQTRVAHLGPQLALDEERNDEVVQVERDLNDPRADGGW